MTINKDDKDLYDRVTANDPVLKEFFDNIGGLEGLDRTLDNIEQMNDAWTKKLGGNND